VARRTREAMLLCEAAGFDIVLVETVGVGQSETAVAEMVDFFLLLALPGAGDELQGIKRGILELADAVAVTKADGDNLQRARLARTQLASALHYAGAREGRGEPITTCVSSLSGDGLDELWAAIEQQLSAHAASGELATRRQAQAVRWMWSQVLEQLDAAFRAHPQVAAALPALEAEVRAGRASATAAARRLLAAFGHARQGD
jgi:LAO/AO transport system kinase